MPVSHRTPGPPAMNPPNREWIDHAACKGMDVNLFFPPPGDSRKKARPALAVCEGCPVREDCAEDARYYGDRDGIRGGMVGSRRRSQPFRLQKVQVARCGTDAGYRAHRRRGEDACVECKKAHADENRGKPRDRVPMGVTKHGDEVEGYNRGCRCASCTSAHRVAMAAYRQKIG